MGDSARACDERLGQKGGTDVRINEVSAVTVLCSCLVLHKHNKYYLADQA